MIVLDTNVVSELTRARPDEAVLAWVDRQVSGELAVTATTVGELLYGVARLPEGRRRSALEDAVVSMLQVDLGGRILAYDGVAAGHFADIVATREAAGRPIDLADAQIAATCRANDAVLATRNTRDFDVTGVDVVDPWTTPPV